MGRDEHLVITIQQLVVRGLLAMDHHASAAEPDLTLQR